jgi:ferric-chelate reductase
VLLLTFTMSILTYSTAQIDDSFYSSPLSRNDIPSFHLIATSSIVFITIALGFFFSRLGKTSHSTSAIYYRLFNRTIFAVSKYPILNDLLGFTIGELTVVTAYVICFFLWFLYGFIFESKPHTMLHKAAKGVGYATIFNLSCVLLPVSRHSVWTWIFNISYERAVRFHRLLGYTTLLSTIAHAVLFGTEYAQKKEFSKLFIWNSAKLLTGVNVLAGVIALTAMILLAFTALPIIRRNMWNTFQFCHVIFGSIVFVFAHLHLPYKMVLPYAAFSIVLYFGDVFIRYFSFIGNSHILRAVYRSRTNHFVSVRKCEIRAHEHIGVTTVKLICDRSLFFNRACPEDEKLLNASDLQKLERKIQNLCLGKFIYLWIWEVSTWESHPFSITQVSVPDLNTVELRLDVKETGGSSEAWAGKLNWLASSAECMEVLARFDGPFGRLTIPVNKPQGVKQYDHVLLFAGGIGITAVNALAEYCITQNANSHLIWAVRSPSYLLLLPNLVARKDHVKVFVTRGGDHNSDSYVTGRPAWERIIMRYVNNTVDCKNVAVVICGPGPMIVDILQTCRKLESNLGIHFHTHVECFEL